MRKNLTTILPIAISLLLILLPPALTGRLRMFAAAPLRPVGEGRRMLAANVGRLFGRPSSEREAALVEENERLRGEIAGLKGRLSDTQNALAAYRAFRANRRRYGLPEGGIVGAAIIFKGGTGPMRRTFYIDHGSLDGLSEGMPVVCGEALVGVINAVGPAMSEVVLLGDPRLKMNPTAPPMTV
jgi:cell shape-determining protein MreC